MITDYHMHLRRPLREREQVDHTADAVAAYVRTARSRGIDEIGVSEHAYYFTETRELWDVDWCLERCRLALGDYVDAVLEAKARALPVKLGLEVDWAGEAAPRLDEILAPYPWDYLLVSVHWIDGAAVDQQPGLWAARDVEEVWRAYVRDLCAAARSGLFDALAHPDLAKIFGLWPGAAVLEALYDELAFAAAEGGVAVEVSAAGLHKPVGEIYPAPALLEACRTRGVSITLASDAHHPSDVGRDADAIVAHARAAGYETVTVFDQRTARQEPLG